MKAPIQNFYEEIIDHQNEVYTCDHRIENKPCATHLFRAQNIASYILDEPSYVCVNIDDVINTYEKQTEKPRYPTLDGSTSGKVATLASTWNGLSLIPPSVINEDVEVYCRNCNGFLGYRDGTKMQFQYLKLAEIWVMDSDHCVAEYAVEVKSSRRRRR